MTATLRGPGLDGVVIDEAAYVEQRAWTQALRPALADRQGWALFISTSAGFNWFHDLFQQGQRDGKLWMSWQRPTTDNPDVLPEELEQARQELGDVLYRQEFLAEFIDFATLKPFRAEWLTYWGTDEVREPPRQYLEVAAGFDPAISKRDTALPGRRSWWPARLGAATQSSVAASSCWRPWLATGHPSSRPSASSRLCRSTRSGRCGSRSGLPEGAGRGAGAGGPHPEHARQRRAREARR